MKTIEAFSRIMEFKQPVLHTFDVSAILKIAPQYASQLLCRLSHENLIIPLKRGLWLFDKAYDPYQLTPYLTAPSPCYLSLYTALYFHAMISQIPDVIYVITVARAHRRITNIGNYSFHHVNPDFFFGFVVSNHHIRLATPEKALIDTLYLIPARSKLFHSLPELTLPDDFNMNTARDIIARIPSKRTRSLVSTRLDKLLSD
jgi:predicted transcriptional regulator of viral defense system